MGTIITSAVEHSSVMTYCRTLESEGVRVTFLPVDRDGLLKLADLEAAFTTDTAIVSLMWANNETGVLFPVEEVTQLCKANGILLHCDAVQAVGKFRLMFTKFPWITSRSPDTSFMLQKVLARFLSAASRRSPR